MLTRRTILKALPAAFAKAAHRVTPVDFAVPPNACDCHTHIFGDPRQFPFAPDRTYTPEPALPLEMAAVHRALHVKRVVIVTPSVYGTDNAATIYGVHARGANARGVAVINEKTTDQELDTMAAAGICGIRLNLATGAQIDLPAARLRFTAAVDRIKSRKWHVQIYTGAATIAGLKDLVSDSPVPVVFDHFGGIQTSLGPEQPGFAELVELLRSGNAYVKISGAYRASTQAPDYADVAPYAKGLILANPDRVLWGTDWPHPNSAPSKDPTKVTPPLPIDDGRLFNQFALWVPDPQIRRKILVENPARLFGF
jgi:predicted TIM-barrel fold metal-dependent hydrolase